MTPAPRPPVADLRERPDLRDPTACARLALACLEAIAADPAARPRVGFKPAGGIRTVADAQTYLVLVREILGDTALSPQRFRIGASGLLDDIEAVLTGRVGADGRPAAY